MMKRCVVITHFARDQPSYIVSPAASKPYRGITMYCSPALPRADLMVGGVIECGHENTRGSYESL